MATAKISVGSLGITGHLLGVIRKTSDLSTVVQKVDLYPANNGDFEYVGLDPDMYRFETRDSPDGIALGTLIGSTYSINVQDNEVNLEYLFYTVDGPDTEDPHSLQSDIIDTYLNGKNVQGVFKEGFRFLKKNIEYSLISGGGIHLEGGTQFSPGEVFTVIIASIGQALSTTAGLFAGSVTLVADTLLDSSHTNRSISCESTTTRMVNTFPDISSIVEGKFFYFTTNGGAQFNTVFNTSAGNQITGYGTQIILGKKERLWIEKRGSQWRVLDVSPGVSMVGKRSAEGYNAFENMLPEDDRLIARLDLPRLHYWAFNLLPVNSKIVTTDGLIATLARVNNSRGQFMVSPNYLRMPNSQGWAERGLANFTTFGTDTTRNLDYPGGWMPARVGSHFHKEGVQTKDGDPDFDNAPAHNVQTWLVAAGVVSKPSSTDYNRQPDGTLSGTNNDDNIGVIYMRYI